MNVRCGLGPDSLLYQYPRLKHLVCTLNIKLRSYCRTGNKNYTETDDGGFPRIDGLSFDRETVEQQQRILEDTRIGKRPKKIAPLKVTLEIDYGNGYREPRGFVFTEEEEDALLSDVCEKSMYLFRSLYGIRKGKPRDER